MRYRDFTLQITADGTGGYTVRVLESPAGQTSGRFELPFLTRQLPEVLDDLDRSIRNLTPPGLLPERRRSTPREVGTALFRALFPEPVRSVLDRSLGSVDDSPEGGLRIKLQLDPTVPELAWLHRLPWELLHRPGPGDFPDAGDFLAFGRRSPIVRHLEVPRPIRLLPLPSPLRILVVISRAGSVELDLDRERRNLERIWGGRDGVEVVYLERARLGAVRNALLEREFHVLHFMGHGTVGEGAEEGALLFERSDRGAAPVTGGDLASVLQDETLRLVCLNACSTAELGRGPGADGDGANPFAAVAAALVRGGIPAVVAMQRPISDRAAIAFGRAFYRRLAAGDPVDSAVVEGRHGIRAEDSGSGEWATPVLFLRLADGRLFEKDAGEEGLLDRYLERVIEDSRWLELPGLPELDHRPRIPLEAVFVSLRGDPAALEERHLRAPEGEGERKGAELADAFRAHPRLVILGDPGGGKTTLVRWLALRLASARRDGGAPPDELGPGPAPVPILLRVGAFAHRRRARPGLRLAEFLGHHLEPEPGVAPRDPRGEPLDPDALNRLLRRRLAASDAVVLLDGLDEVADPSDQHEVVREIEAFASAYLSADAADREPDAANRLVVTSRIVGYHLASLGVEATHLKIEPIEPAAAERFCAAWTEAVHRAVVPADRWNEVARTRAREEGRALAAALTELRSRGAGGLTGNPLLITVVALLFHHGRRDLPARRIELYGAAVRILVDRWRRRSCALDEPPLEEGEVIAVLLPVAAEIHRGSSLGTISDPELTRLLERHLPDDRVAAFRRVLRREMGLLVERGEGVYGFLHLAFQEYLAARWLAEAPGPLERLGHHLDDPRWREPVLMALGLLSEPRNDAELDELLRRFLELDDPHRHLLPRPALLLVAALPEMDRRPEAAVESAARQLLAVAPPAGSAIARVVERAFGRLLADDRAAPTAERILRRALVDPGDDTQARTAATLISATGRFTPDLAEALGQARPRDAPPWPIERALRRIAAVDPALLPAPRTSLRRTLGRKPELAASFLADPGRRRIGLLVYGGASPEGGFDPACCHRDSPALTRVLLDAADAGRTPAELAGELRRLLDGTGREPEGRIDAALALVALGEPLPEHPAAGGDGVAAALARAAAVLAETPVRLEPLVEPLGRLAADRPPERWRHLVDPILELVPAAERRPAALLRLAELAPDAARPYLLADLWHLLLTPRRGEPAEGTPELPWHDPVYNLAVTLDTAGEVLSSPPRLLAETLAVTAGRPWSRDSGWRIPRAASPGAGLRELLGVALSALDAIPDAFDFARGWALVRLAPLLEEAGLSSRALHLAAGLSDRLDARRETLRRIAPERPEPAAGGAWTPLPPGPPLPAHPPRPPGERGEKGGEKTSGSLGALLDHQDALADAGAPAGVGDHLTAVGLIRDALRDGSTATGGSPSAPPELEDAECDGLSERTLPVVLELLTRPDDLLRHRAALALYGDASVTRRRPTVRRLGAAAVHRLARAWLERREDRPRTAVVVRWAFESLEHDDTGALRRWIRLAGEPGPEEVEATMILGDLHALRGDLWPVLAEGLRSGPAPARRALLHSLCTLLARRRVPAERWPELATAVPSVAAAVGDEQVLFAGPGAVVDAAEEALDRRGEASAEAVAEAERSYLAAGTPWREVLRREPAELRATLTEIGGRRLIGNRFREEGEAAAERIVERPPLLDLLLHWLGYHFDRDVRSAGRHDHLLRDLLTVAAAAAWRLPDSYLRKTQSLSAWDRYLKEVAEEGDRFPARRAAIELLSLGRRLTRHAAAALRAGLLDVHEVQRAALASVMHYRRLDDGLEEQLTEDLHAESPALAFATARLLATLARNAHFAPDLRRRLTTALAGAVEDPRARRPVHLLVEEPEGRHHRRRRIRHLGRLDHLCHHLLAETSGLLDLFPTTDDGSDPGKEHR